MVEEKVFVGIDWADAGHGVAVYSPGSDRRRRFSVAHTAAGLKALMARLKEAGTVEGVAVEGKPEILVALLMQAGCKVYGVNPKLASSWREAQSVVGAKTDEGSAEMLAEQLAVQHRKLRPAPARAESSCVLARLLAMFGDDRACYADARAVQKLSGVAPVTEQSGRSRKVHIRRACRKHWRNPRPLFAHTSQMKCPWARAFYQCCRQRGDKEAVALRKLSYKWLKIIFRMWQTKQPYDEQKYLPSLRKSRSPLIAYMAAQNAGG